MAEEPKSPAEQADGGSGTATVQAPQKAPQRPKPRLLPPYKVLLHNDDVNDMEHVVLAILKITPLSLEEAEARMFEAHRTGVALILMTHKERAELYQEQFCSCGLIVTIEPDGQ